MNAVTQEVPVSEADLPLLEEQALVLANRISTLLTRRSTRFTSPLVLAISMIPLPTGEETARTRARRTDALRSVKTKYRSVMGTAVPLWERLNEPRLDEIKAVMRELAIVIDAIEP